jgi:UDP-2,3-diacylglucosamine hydrolase
MTAPRVYFVSDLHLFTRRSLAARYLDELQRLSREADSFVLGGDIFDFEWTTLESIDATVAAASRWLRELTEASPNCQFHLLLGNHDHYGEFIDQLDGLDRRHENFAWHPYYVRLGNSLFLHGDAADGGGCPVKLEQNRLKRPMTKKRGVTANWLYDMFVRAGLHRPVPVLAYPKGRTARRLLKYMNQIGHGPESGVEHVYFGHTHRELNNYRYRGISFHNGGAPMQGVPFRIVAAGQVILNVA